MSCKFSGFASFVMLVGRICFSLIFVIAGYQKLVGFGPTAATMAAKGVPYTDIMLVIAIVFELGGGLLVLLGWYARLGAFLIFLFIIPVVYVFHSFWALSGPQMALQMIHFLKNLAIMGGALYIVAVGAGHFSIDGWARKACCRNKD